MESPQLHAIFLMLCKELRESDISGQMTIQKCVTEVFNEYLSELEQDMKVNFNLFFVTIQSTNSTIEIKRKDLIHDGYVD